MLISLGGKEREFGLKEIVPLSGGRRKALDSAHRVFSWNASGRLVEQDGCAAIRVCPPADEAQSAAASEGNVGLRFGGIFRAVPARSTDDPHQHSCRRSASLRRVH